MHKRSAARSRSWLGRFLACIAIASLVWVGCMEVAEQPTSPTTNEKATVDSGAALELSQANPRVHQVMTVQDRHTPQLMQVPDVVGTAIKGMEGFVNSFPFQ